MATEAGIGCTLWPVWSMAMISQARLDQLVGEVRATERRLESLTEMGRIMVEGRESYRYRTLMPAESVSQAAEDERLAAASARLGGEQRLRLLGESQRLRRARRVALWTLYEEGAPTGRWIASGGGYVHLERRAMNRGVGDPAGEIESGLELYEIPARMRRYIVPGEDPRITCRRVEYGVWFQRGHGQMLAVVGLVMAVALVGRLEFLPWWFMFVGLAAVMGGSSLVLRDGLRMAVGVFGPGCEAANRPFEEVVAHTGERCQPAVRGREQESAVDKAQAAAKLAEVRDLCRRGREVEESQW